MSDYYLLFVIVVVDAQVQTTHSTFVNPSNSGGAYSGMEDICIDQQNNLYVYQWASSSSVQKYSSSGSLITQNYIK